MRTSEPKTPLLALLRQLDERQRREFAARAGTSVSYLYHLAGCDRQCRVGLAKSIAEASTWMSGRVAGLPVLTMEEIATMCDCAQ
jgi:hypothetical protein